jgi:hypothetical protein
MRVVECLVVELVGRLHSALVGLRRSIPDHALSELLHERRVDRPDIENRLQAAGCEPLCLLFGETWAFPPADAGADIPHQALHAHLIAAVLWFLLLLWLVAGWAAPAVGSATAAIPVAPSAVLLL